METHVSIGQKTSKPQTAWGTGATPDYKLKAQYCQNQFCHSLCINYSCLYLHPISPKLWGLTKTVFLMPPSMRLTTSRHGKEITESCVVPRLRPRSQELPTLFLTLGPSMNYTSSIISLHLNILTLH